MIFAISGEETRHVNVDVNARMMLQTSKEDDKQETLVKQAER